MTDFTITSHNPEGLIQQLRAIQQTGCGALTEECWAIAAQIEEQVKPAVEEPTEFGSIIRALSPQDAPATAADLWMPTPRRKHYWMSQSGLCEVWSELSEVEVLRVGVGPQPLAEWESNLLNEQEVRAVATAVLSAMDVDQYLIDAVANARPS